MAEISSSSSAQLLQQVGQLLEADGIRWAAIGALAVAYHGLVRASLDANALVTFNGSTTDLDRLTDKLRNSRLKVESRVGDEDDPLGFVIRISDDKENLVDLIGGIKKLDVGFFDRSVQADFDGLTLRISSPEDLVALKIYAGGPKDLEDAAGVLDVTGSEIDEELLQRLCKRFGPEEEKRCAQPCKT